MKTLLVAAALALTACGGTARDPVVGIWEFRVADIGDQYETHGLVELREDGTGEALHDGCDPIHACGLSGPVRWARTAGDLDGNLRIDFYLSTPTTDAAQLYAETSLDLPFSRGIFHGPPTYPLDGEGFIAKLR